MTGVICGPHHCAGVVTHTAENIFHYLRHRCQENGGSLSVSDIDSARIVFFDNIPKAGNYLESVHDQCVKASHGSAPELFSRENILSSLLFRIGHKSALAAFQIQTHDLGANWIKQLFDGMARYIRSRICADIEERLLGIYFGISAQSGSKLTFDVFFNDKRTQHVMDECLGRLMSAEPDEKMTEALSAEISSYIARLRHISGPDRAKVTDMEVRKFLSLLRSELAIALHHGEGA